MTINESVGQMEFGGTYSVSRADAHDEPLLASVLTAVDDVAETATLGMHPEDPAITPQQLPILRLLTYCYASGLLISGDIEAALHQNPTLRWLAGGEVIYAPTLRTFRRRSRELLVTCLTRILEDTTGFSTCRSAHRRAPSRGYLGTSLARWQPAALSPLALRNQAEMLVDRAVRIDSAQLDE